MNESQISAFLVIVAVMAPLVWWRMASRKTHIEIMAMLDVFMKAENPEGASEFVFGHLTPENRRRHVRRNLIRRDWRDLYPAEVIERMKPIC